jgi:hypothetical protein
MARLSLFASGPDNPRWAGGRHTTGKGYVRLKTRVGRGKYEHRFVMEQMLRAPVGLMFAGEGKIPAGMDVHHFDGNRQHNCQGNLMLLQACIHNAISRSYKKFLIEHYDEYVTMVARENEPEWLREATA